jgi:hypothetical protein
MNMRKVSSWAKSHVVATRLLIIFLVYPLLNLTGWITGIILSTGNITLGPGWGYVLSSLTFILFAAYPDRKKKAGYWHRKTFDVLLVATCFGFIVLTGNQLSSPSPGQGLSFRAYASEKPAKARTTEAKTIKKEKGLGKLFRKFKQAYKKTNNAGKAALIFLSVLVALFLISLLGALACNIACGGSEALAYAIFFLGLGGIIFALVKVIHRILKGPVKKEPVLKPS